jgi:hypothetical protein
MRSAAPGGLDGEGQARGQARKHAANLGGSDCVRDRLVRTARLDIRDAAMTLGVLAGPNNEGFVGHTGCR